MAKKIALTPFLEEALLRQAAVSYPFNPHAKEIKKIATCVKKISDEYISADSNLHQLFKHRDLLPAYLVYYLPVNLVKIYPILDELFAHPEIKAFQGTSLSILDLGCGPGTFLLGTLEYLGSNKTTLSTDLRQIELWGIDQVQESLSLAENLFLNIYLYQAYARQLNGIPTLSLALSHQQISLHHSCPNINSLIS